MPVPPHGVESIVTPVAPREFRLDRQNRRCGWYVLIGAVCCTILAGLLERYELIPPAAPGAIEQLPGCLLFLCGSLLLLGILYRWRLRLDERGLARRRLWRWDEWPWSEFTSGQIVRDHGRFRAPRRPFWRKVLDPNVLAPEDRDEVYEACERRLPPLYDAPPSEFPDGLTLRYQLFCSLTLQTDGLSARSLRGTLNFPWSDVHEARFIRENRFAPEAVALELDLPGRVVRVEGASRLVEPGGPRNAAGLYIPRQIEQFLSTKLPAGRVLLCARGGPPQSAAEHDLRRRQAETKLRFGRRWQWILPAFLLLLLLAAFAPAALADLRLLSELQQFGSIAAFLVVAGIMFLGLPASIWGLFRWNIHQQRRELARLAAYRHRRS